MCSQTEEDKANYILYISFFFFATNEHKISLKKQMLINYEILTDPHCVL